MGQLINPQMVAKAICEMLYKFSAALELAWAWNAGENLIMYGPGGYGKSVAAVKFFHILKDNGCTTDEKPFILSFDPGMTEEKLLGGVDIKHFKEIGDIRYLLNNAFIQHEVVIFEELWDAYPAVLLMLKDILTSGYVRKGTQMVKIRTKMIIACTNRSREEVVEDASTEALMQRFLFEKEVSWSSWEQDDYYNALKGVVEDDLANAISGACAKASEGDHKISPRTAHKAAKAAAINGIECLAGMYGFAEIISGLLAHKSEMERESAQKDHYMTIHKLMENHLQVPSRTKSAIKIAEAAKRCHIMLTQLDPAMDANVGMRKELESKLGSAAYELLCAAGKLIVDPPKESFAAQLKWNIDSGRWGDALAMIKLQRNEE